MLQLASYNLPVVYMAPGVVRYCGWAPDPPVALVTNIASYKVIAGVSGQTFVYSLETPFCLCEYATISKTVDIVIQPID